MGLACTFISCKDDDDANQPNPVPPVTYADYTNLKVGNYWIYQRYEVDSNGNGTATTKYDSCFVEKDTIINAKIYHKVVRPSLTNSNSPDIYFLRDSLHYTINHIGGIMLSTMDFINTFESSYYILVPDNDTVAYISRKMADPNVSITVPAGTYLTINSKKTYVMYYPFNGAGTYRHMHSRYAKNVGLILETFPFYASNPIYTERRLVSYHLN